MKVQAKMRFRDLEAKQYRQEKEEFTVNAERGAALIEKGLVTEVGGKPKPEATKEDKTADKRQTK